MSLGIVIKAPEGLVLAAESRVTLTTQQPSSIPIHVNFDNATKLLSFSQPHNNVGVVTYGLAAIGLRTVHSYLPEFETILPNERITVEEFANRLSTFIMQQWNSEMPANYQGPSMTLVIAGYDNNEPYGRVFVVDIPKNTVPVEQHPNAGDFGITWGGQREFVDRLIQGRIAINPLFHQGFALSFRHC